MTTPKAPQPVVIATVGQCASLATGLGMYAALRPHPHLLLTIMVWGVLCVLVFLMYRALLRGANWLRWLISACIVVGVLRSPSAVAEFPERWQGILYVAQAAVQAATVVLLFLPVSNRWFSRTAEA